MFKIVDVYSGSRPFRFDDRCSSVISCHGYCCHGRHCRRRHRLHCHRHYHLLADLCDHRSDYFDHDYFDRRLDWQSLLLKPDNLYNMRGMVVFVCLIDLVIQFFILCLIGKLIISVIKSNIYIYRDLYWNLCGLYNFNFLLPHLSRCI